MKTLVFLLAVLGCCTAQGWLTPRCDLKYILTFSIGNINVTFNNTVLSGQDLVTKIICHAEVTSGFNTSTVKQVSIKIEGDHSSRPNRPHARGPRHDKRPLRTRPGLHDHSPSHDHYTEIWTLYGIFQLSNRLVCSDSVTPSPNICGMSCNKLLDSNVSDDINCLLKVLTYGNTIAGRNLTEELKTMLGLLFKEECNYEPETLYCPLP